MFYVYFPASLTFLQRQHIFNDGSVGIVTRLCAGRPKNLGLFPGDDKVSLHVVQTKVEI
jgi:hypothetical protein